MADPLKNSDGSLNTRALSTAVIVSLVGAFFGGIADVVRQVWESFVLTPLAILAEYQTLLVENWMQVPQAAIDTSFAQTAAFVQQFGIFAFAVSAAFTLTIAYTIAQGWKYV